MSGTYNDGDTLAFCGDAHRVGRTLDYLTGRLNVDTEFLGRLLQLPTSSAASDDQDGDLWAADRLDGVL